LTTACDLVTGASGFVGRALVARLAERGAAVHAVSRAPAAATAPGVQWHALDCEDERAVGQLVERLRPRRVFHLAGLVTGRRDVDLVLPALRANLLAAVHLLVAAQRAGVERVVLAGSMEEPAPGEPPSSPYAAAKGAASSYAALFHALYALPVVTARIFMVYGPGQRDLTKVVPASILTALAGERPRISTGTRPVDWIYLDDVVDGLCALGEAPGIEGRTLDLGSGEQVTVRAIVEEICRLCGVEAPAVGAVPDRPLETTRRADVEATHAGAGFRARVSRLDGLTRTIAWLRARRGDGEPFSG
jgi:nucleoside-diphosphate-sugar epimerase